ncbi:hypothetical protein [Streptomyces sp. NPDC056053]|uniref:hypothetical protein n=1 Tax=Streptomyces sp. NPDC056053 TaxID=3345696 RepID=UPI0035D80523
MEGPLTSRFHEAGCPTDGQAYAGLPETYGSDPVETPWMEAGPDRITVIRAGVIVHQGRHALARPDTAEPRLITAAGPDGTLGMAVFQEREHTPTELDTLEQRILAQGAETAARYRRGNNAE